MILPLETGNAGKNSYPASKLSTLMYDEPPCPVCGMLSVSYTHVTDFIDATGRERYRLFMKCLECEAKWSEVRRIL
jgi:hypothetical protein